MPGRNGIDRGEPSRYLLISNHSADRIDRRACRCRPRRDPSLRCPGMVGYDVVLRGGRVVDPESGLDDVRDVGVEGRRIGAVSTEPLDGATVVDVSGMVVAPGFIDLH